MDRPSSLRPRLNLPPELQDMIIDNLHDDKGALRACALVCKNWLPTTRYHLFDSIKHQEDDSKYDHFLEFLLDAAHIAAYIRKIRFRGYVPAMTLLGLLRAMPGLTRIVLHEIVVNGYHESTTWTDDLLITLLSMPRLVDLRINGQFYSAQSTLPLAATLSAITGLPRLAYFQSYLQPNTLHPTLWRGIARTKSAPGVAPLRMLDVPIDLKDECDATNAQELSLLLKTVGNSLHTLALDFRVIEAQSVPEVERVLSKIDFSPCLYLRSVEVRILLNNSVDSTTLSALAFILSRIPATTIGRLVIAIWNVNGLQKLKLSSCKAPLKRLDRVLCEFPKLKTITFRSVDKDHGEAEKEKDSTLFEWVIEHLPNTEKKKGMAIGYSGGDLCV